MSKTDELEILREAVAKLGPGSYCGPWLAGQIPGIEADIRGDVVPLADWHADRLEREADALRQRATLDALRTRDAANDLVAVGPRRMRRRRPDRFATNSATT